MKRFITINHKVIEMDPNYFLSLLVFVLLVGLAITLISRKLRISHVLFLILGGLILGSQASNLDIQISHFALVILAIIALVTIVFDGSSKFKIKTVDDLSFKAIKLILWFIFFNILIITIPVSFLFFGSLDAVSIIYSIIFAVIMAATDPATLFSILREKTNRVIEFVKVESIINTPLTIILPFVFLSLIDNINLAPASLIEVYFTNLMTNVIVGIGAGVLIGFTYFKAMKKFYSEKISPLALITACLLTYILSENIGGSGVLAVAVLGFIFGNMWLSHKEELKEFSSMFSGVLEILVFISLGFIVQLNLNFKFVLYSFIIFLLLIVSRYLSVYLFKKEYDSKERWFLTLNMPKGVGTAVLVFSLSVLGYSGLEVVNNLIIMVMIYSLVLSTIVCKYSDRFINLKID